MALIPNPEYRLLVDATKLVITDKTVAYDDPSNVGGWGDPNPELSESAVFVIVVRKASTGDQLLAMSNRFVYDDGAANSKETGFEVPFSIDGTFEITLGRLPVSLDGSTLVEGGSISEGEYFYYNGTAYQMISSVATEVTDLTELVGATGVTQKTCSDILYPLLAKKKQALYKQYRIARETGCNTSVSKFNEVVKLGEDLRAASYTYFSNLKVEAQDQIETLLDRFSILSQV